MVSSLRGSQAWRVFQNVVILDLTLLARFWIVFCNQALSCCMTQCGMARTGGTVILSTTSTSRSQRGGFMSGRVNSIFQVLGNKGLKLNFANLPEESLGEGVV